MVESFTLVTSTILINTFLTEGVKVLTEKLIESGIGTSGSGLPQKVKEDSRYQEAMLTYTKRSLQLKEQELQVKQELSKQKLQQDAFYEQAKITQKDQDLQLKEQELQVKQELSKQKLQQDAFYEQAKIAQKDRDLQLKKEQVEARREFSQKLLNLLRERQANTNNLKLREIQNDWDNDNWFSNLDRQETEQILGNNQHRLLILVSKPEISKDCPDSFHNNLKNEIRIGIGQFLSQHYPLGNPLSPVEFYGDYFNKPIPDIGVKQLQSVIETVPTAILYSDISDYQINFCIVFWGLQSNKVLQFCLPALNWEDAYQELQQKGKQEKEALRDIRQIIVNIQKLLAAFIADWYYLQINPVYEPQLFQLESKFLKEWVAPFIEQLQAPYRLNQADVYYQRGLQLAQLEHYREAVASFDIALEFQPELAEILYNKGRALQNLGEAEKAIACYDKALEIQPDYPEARFYREIALLPGRRNYKFDVITVNASGREIKREKKQAEHYTEDLGKGITLEMVIIRGGTFMMGSPLSEKERRDYESPQHLVTVAPFFMGKYPITQAQWQAVSSLDKVERDINPDPSSFKGDNRPVEQISWYDAVEFCKRLSIATSREYRLPSEAEWEYACRAGTTTPFHFGETITTDLANYNGNYIYANAPKGIYRQTTTPVGQFPANAFGLCDMHGNILEWCADHWHSNYDGAPSDGRAWLTNKEKHSRLLRGTSCHKSPSICRSAHRRGVDPSYRETLIGFRVVAVASLVI